MNASNKPQFFGGGTPTPEQRAAGEERSRAFLAKIHEPKGAIGELMTAISAMLYGEAILTYTKVGEHEVPMIAKLIQKDDGSVTIVPLLVSAGELHDIGVAARPSESLDAPMVAVKLPNLQTMAMSAAAVRREQEGTEGCGDPECKTCNPDYSKGMEKAETTALDAIIKAKRAPDGGLTH